MTILSCGGLIFTIILGISPIVLFISPTLKNSCSLETMRANTLQRADITKMKKSRRLDAQGVRKGKEEQYKLLVRTEIPTCSNTEAPRLTIILHNESKKKICIIETGTPRDFNFEVKDKDGRIMLPKSAGRKGLTVNEGKQSVVCINAGQKVSYEVTLSDLYSLASGEYTLTVQKTILLGDKQTTVKAQSAPIKFVFNSSK
jgi:hypothetical protein